MRKCSLFLQAVFLILALNNAARADMIKQSTAYHRTVLVTLSSDHITGATGKTLTVTACKNNAGAFTSISPTVTEIGNGRYDLLLTASHTDTLGSFDLYITAPSCDPTDTHDQIIAADLADAVRLGLSALPNANASASGGLPTVGTSSGQISLSSGSVTAASVTADVGITQAGADKVWETATRALTDKSNFALSTGGVQAIWDAATSALTTAGSVGKRLADNIDAATSSRMATFVYTTPPTVAQIRTEMDTNSTKLAHLDADVSTRSTLDAPGVWASGTRTLTASLDPTSSTIAAAVWDLATSGHTTSGTFGAAMSAAGAAGDPWSATLPGSYGAGTAGYIVGTNLDALISSRLPTTSYSAPLSAGAVENAVWNAPRASHTTTGTFGEGAASVQGPVATLTDKSGFSLSVTPPTAAQVRAEMDSNSTRLAHLDADISTRSSHTAADVWASGTRTLTASLDPSSGTIASAVWDALRSAHTTTGSFGEGVLVADKTGFSLSVAPLSASAVENAVWDGLRSNHVTTGTFGQGVASVQGNVTGTAQLDLTQALSTGQTGDTVGGGLLAARAQGFGKWSLSGTTLTLYAANGTTVVRTFTLNDAANPTSRQ